MIYVKGVYNGGDYECVIEYASEVKLLLVVKMEWCWLSRTISKWRPRYFSKNEVYRYIWQSEISVLQRREEFEADLNIEKIMQIYCDLCRDKELKIRWYDVRQNITNQFHKEKSQRDLLTF